MGRYIQEVDGFGVPIIEAINEVVEVEVSVSSSLTDEVITVPNGCYGFVVKRLPVQAKVKVNGQANGFTIDEGDKFSVYAKTVQSMTITTSTVDASNPVIIQFLT